MRLLLHIYIDYASIPPPPRIVPEAGSAFGFDGFLPWAGPVCPTPVRDGEDPGRWVLPGGRDAPSARPAGWRLFRGQGPCRLYRGETAPGLPHLFGGDALRVAVPGIQVQLPQALVLRQIQIR